VLALTIRAVSTFRAWGSAFRLRRRRGWTPTGCRAVRDCYSAPAAIF